jgi:HEAT repeats
LSSRTGKKLAFAAILVVLAGAALVWQRTALISWYDVHRLAQAEENQRARWVERVAGLDFAAVPGLINLLRRDDARACGNAEAALSAVMKRWGPSDAKTVSLAETLLRSFPCASSPGQAAILEWYQGLLHEIKGTDGPVLDLCREFAAQGLGSNDPETCTGAIRLVLQVPSESQKGLLDRVVPFLKNPSSQARCAAVLAVGLAEDTIAVEELLPLLQDPDSEVRRLCEVALRGRGLQDSHIRLAKLITDEHPGQRLQVIHYLKEAGDLDPAIWLMRLSQDPSPAVRAAVVRFAAAGSGAVGFQPRLLQMSREDPSPTVRQLASHYYYWKTHQH